MYAIPLVALANPCRPPLYRILGIGWTDDGSVSCNALAGEPRRVLSPCFSNLSQEKSMARLHGPDPLLVYPLSGAHNATDLLLDSTYPPRAPLRMFAPLVPKLARRTEARRKKIGRRWGTVLKRSDGLGKHPSESAKAQGKRKRACQGKGRVLELTSPRGKGQASKGKKVSCATIKAC
jgi:hypothetical protein